MAKFEVIKEYKDQNINLPVRVTAHAAGYDFEAAEDIIIPSYFTLCSIINGYIDISNNPFTTLSSGPTPKELDEMATLTKKLSTRPTLIPTGIKCQLADNEYLELAARSSMPLKYWFVLANGEGIIDADYYNNPDNEGHIMFQYINFSPSDIIIRKGERIGQGIIRKYYTTEDDIPGGERTGGFGSSGK